MDHENPYASPLTDNTEPEGQEVQSRGLGWVLFSFQGRIPRRTYWGASIVTWLVMYLVLIPIVSLPSDEVVVSLFLLAVVVPVFWIGLSVSAKRWHDRNKSGWWILIGFIPYLGPIWTLVECGCLRGTVGPNQYGDDPT